MRACPTIASIHERLKQAQKDTLVILPTHGASEIVAMNDVVPPKSRWIGEQTLDRYIDHGSWRTSGTGFQRLQDWVDVHWNPENEKQAPCGTVSIDKCLSLQAETQIDSVSAARKLIVAAKFYGPEQVTKHAIEFATHGMIETKMTYLMKGPPIMKAKPFDEYCSLLPYRDARQKIDAETDSEDLGIKLPVSGNNVCALEGRYFGHCGAPGGPHKQYTSPLLKDGPEQLACLLGIVWGNGWRVFGSWYSVLTSAAAALPYRHLARRRGAYTTRVALELEGPQFKMRPLAVTELRDLAAKYSNLPERSRHKLARAMAGLRDSTERINEHDRVVDVGIALNIVFTDEDEQTDHVALIPRRVAWHYSDSQEEREQTEDMLHQFYTYYSNLLYGGASKKLSTNSAERTYLQTHVENVLRTCLKTIIVNGSPKNWNQAMERSALRLDPPRPTSEILSVKSDSLSWTVDEQTQIDQNLEAVWRPLVERAPRPPSNISSTVIDPVLKQVEFYREQNIPYVVVHPARLYMAHPNWPKTATEPLDERTRYYCEKDVERHTTRWLEAGSGKGLVLFELPTDADTYHPKFRDDWPQPLLSSHEENDPSPQISDRRTETGEVSCDSTDHGQHATAEERPDKPSAELLKSVVSRLEVEWPRLWRAFRHDVNVTTSSLLHTLEAIHIKHSVERQHLIQMIMNRGGAIKTIEDAARVCHDSNFVLSYPRLRVAPLLTGESLFRRTEPNGPMEQAVFRGWISDVYDQWESRYRNRLRHEISDLPGRIRPRQQVLGDLRHIRNNLLHNGVAKQGEAASCEILRWFKANKPMHVQLRHVFDFLNQMGWLSEDPVNLLEEGKLSHWFVNRDGEAEDPPPALVSVRPLVYPEEQDPCRRYAASVVFENGLFGLFPMGPKREETAAQAKSTALKWMKMTVNEKGDLCVPGVGSASATKLYEDCIQGERRQGPGVWSPEVQFRE